MGILDIIVFFGFIAAVLTVGMIKSRGVGASSGGADDYFLAAGQTDEIAANVTYDRMVVQGDLSIAPGVTVNAGTILMASNVTSRLTLGDAAKLYVTSATNEHGLDALFGTRGGHAYVTLGTRAAVEITGKASKPVSCGFFLNPSGSWDPRVSEGIDFTTEEQTFSFDTTDTLILDMPFEMLFQFGSADLAEMGDVTIEISNITILQRSVS